MGDRTSIQACWHRLTCTITSDADQTEAISIFQQLHPDCVKAKLSPALLNTTVCYFHGARGHIASGVTTDYHSGIL